MPIGADSPIPESQYSRKLQCLRALTACELAIARTERIERMTDLVSTWPALSLHGDRTRTTAPSSSTIVCAATVGGRGPPSFSPSPNRFPTIYRLSGVEADRVFHTGSTVSDLVWIPDAPSGLGDPSSSICGVPSASTQRTWKSWRPSPNGQS